MWIIPVVEVFYQSSGLSKSQYIFARFPNDGPEANINARPCRSNSSHIHVCCVLHAVSLCNNSLTDRILAYYVTLQAAQTKQVK